MADRTGWIIGALVAAAVLLKGTDASASVLYGGDDVIPDRKLFGSDAFDWPQIQAWTDKLPAAGQPYAQDIIDLAQRFQVHPGLLAAIVDLESGYYLNLKPDGTGDDGHGHGPWQIDDRSHADWLAVNDPMDFHAAGLYAVGSILVPSYRYMLQHGVADPMASRAGIAGYNAGPGNALHALQQTGDPNAATWHALYLPSIYKRLAPLL